MKPLRNERHERIALLIAADIDPAEACAMVGMSTDKGNVSRTVNYADIKARVSFLRGEAGADTALDPASDESIMGAVVAVANNPATGDATKLKSLEMIVQLREGATYKPKPGEAFDADKLSPDQLRLCQMYHAHMTSGAAQSPATIIMERINTLAEAKSRAAQPA